MFSYEKELKDLQLKDVQVHLITNNRFRKRFV